MSPRQKPLYIVLLRYPTWYSVNGKPATAIEAIIWTAC